jgi:DeoR family suf operon transcriptional repressor
MVATAYAPDSPAGKILAHLQRHGEATVRELEVLLGISTTAVREHLTHLEARGLLGTRLMRQGPGRPRLMYSLRPRAQELFPKEYGTLVTLLMRELVRSEDPERFQALLDAVGARLAVEYGIQLSGNSLEERLAALRTALAERGIPADVDAVEARLEIYACPYGNVAQEHPAICAMERGMLQQVLGETIRLEGAIREGQRSCHFVVERDEPAPDAPLASS